MINVDFTLHRDNGTSESLELQAEHVPRVGEFFAPQPFHASYQVIDVLWHYTGQTRATVTACEVDWHANMASLMRTWQHHHS